MPARRCSPLTSGDDECPNEPAHGFHELSRRFLEGSAKVVNVPAVIPDAKTSTSDHLPVLTRCDLR